MLKTLKIEDLKSRISALENEISTARKELSGLKRDLPKEEVHDYTFAGQDGSEIRLSDLFGKHNELIVIHNMGKGCAYCTLWADGFNGVLNHLENRAGFVVISPDDPETQRTFAEDRRWKFKMVSGKGVSFTANMGYETDKGQYKPGFSTFHKESDGKIYRTGSDLFGPGDVYCGIWHLFDLLPKGINDWQPKFAY